MDSSETRIERDSVTYIEIRFKEKVNDRRLYSGTNFDIENSNSRGLEDSE